MLPPEYKLQEFSIVRLLGEGGFGITYLAWDNELDGPVAIKEYYPSQFSKRTDGVRVAPKTKEDEPLYQWGYDKFFEEAQLLSKLRHNNIVSIRRVLKENNTLYLVMEFLDGEPLSALIEKEGKISESEWLSWLFALCDGLKQVHGRNILHRDIKPDNIMICANAEGQALPVFIDFGAARPSTISTGKAVTTIATAGYAPIEQQSDDNQPQGPFTDIYALACTSLEALTGVRPDDALKSRILNDKVPAFLEKQRGVLSDRVIDALAWGLKLHSEERPQTLEAWLAAFQQPAGNGSPPSAAPVSEPNTAPSPNKGASQKGGSHSGLNKPPPQPLHLPPQKKSGMLGAVVGIGALTAVVAAVVYFNPGLFEVKPDQSDQRVEACRSIGADNQSRTLIRCYRAVLDDFPGNADARQGELNGLEVLFERAGNLVSASKYDEALTALDDLQQLQADSDRIAKMRQEMYADIVQRAELAIRDRNLTDAKSHVTQLERLGGDEQEVARLRDEIAAIEVAEQQTLTAFAECRRLRQQRQFQSAHECFDKMIEQYPQARDEKTGVENDLLNYIDALLNDQDLELADAQIKVARELGLATNQYERRLERLLDEEAEARKVEQERVRKEQAQKALADAERDDRDRSTYGFQLEGTFQQVGSGMVFTISAVNPALTRIIPLGRGDIIERLDNRPLGDINKIKEDIRQRPSLVENFSAGVPDSRVIDELVLRKLDVARGQVKIRIRRNGNPESIFCKKPGKNIQCSGN